MTIFSWLCCFPKKAKKHAPALSEMDLNETDTSFDAVFPTREQFLESCKAQAFFLPMPIMEYIWSNPSSPEVYQKLIKSCKLFFLKNPILVLNGLDYDYRDGWKYCIENKSRRFFCTYKVFNMDKLNEKKIWVAQKFCVYAAFGSNATPNFVSQFIPKIFRYNVKNLRLFNQNLSYDELKFLASGVKQCYLSCNTIKYGDGKEVPIEKIIQLFAGGNSFLMDFSFQTPNAACKSYDDLVEACNTVKEVTFYFIPAVFDVRNFYESLKRSKSRALVNIHSRSNKTLLDGVINEILLTQSFAFIPPVIKYNGQNESDLKKMEEIQAREAAKYN